MLSRKRLKFCGREKMIGIRNESDFASWFKKNYKKLGFSSIAKDNKGRFPDFIIQEGDKKVRVELGIERALWRRRNPWLKK